MKKFSVLLFGIVFLFGLVTTANAASVTINPDAGWNGYFAWQDVGQIDDISLIEYNYDFLETEWSITVGTDSFMSLATAWDAYMPGDKFALYLDNVMTSWTNNYVDPSGFFHGEYSNLFLSAGTHSITLYVTDLAPNTSAGAALASFSAVKNVVPEPATIFLFGIGLLGFAGVSRRKK